MAVNGTPPAHNSLTQMFPDTGINIISATLHSHVAGRKMRLRHVRNGMELERIVEDDTYDYNFQQVRQLENETNVLPGDYLITDCAYEVWTNKFDGCSLSMLLIVFR